MVGRVQDLQPRLRHLHRRVADPGHRLDDRRSGAAYLIVFRIVQGIGGACLLANAAAIITDAFPANQRGMALGINNIVGVSGMFIGLVLGGILAPIDWRLVFLISVPVGMFGTIWSYRRLRELSTPRRAPIDWWGNITFALGLILRDGRGHLRHPALRAATRSAGGARGCSRCWRARSLCLMAFVIVERRAAEPDVPAAAVPHPRVHVRHAVDVPLRGRPRRADVHADHLAAGHLAARSTATPSRRRRCGRASTCCR